MTSIALPAAPAARRLAPSTHLGALGRASAYLATSLPIAVATFSVIVTALSLALGLAVLIVGLPVALGAVLLVRVAADIDRRRAEWILGEPVRRPARPATSGLLGRLKATLSDGLTWRETAHGLLMFPVATAAWTAWVTVWFAGLAYATAPAWVWTLPADHGDTDLGALDPHTTLDALAVAPIGFAVLLGAALGTPVLARAMARMSRKMLS